MRRGRKRWSRGTKVLVAGAAGAMLVGASVAVVIHRRRRPRIPKVPPPEAAAAPQAPAAEPPEGYQARWEARRTEAIAHCRQDPEVDTWPQALSCVLSMAFPEAAPWTDPVVWSAWMAEAATLVEADLLLEVRPDGKPPALWESMIWLRADRERALCQAEGNLELPGIEQCVATQIYPNVMWTGPLSGWQKDFMMAVRARMKAA